MDEYRIEHPHNEASALSSMANRDLLDALDWVEGFWIANDEKPVHKALAALGRTSAGEWQVCPLKAKRSKGSSKADTDDCECMAQAGSWVYVFGSQFGKKEGPLDPERHFAARTNTALVRWKKKKKKMKLSAPMDVAREPFLLHRLINDALRGSGLTLIRRSPEEAQAFIQATEDAAPDGEYGERIQSWDWPINVEGATFGPNGRLLLGLRYPVTVDGNPIIVEIDGIDRLFEKKLSCGWPRVTRVWALAFVGSPERPLGVRELDQFGRSVHVIVGDLDSKPERSQILAGHPEGHHGQSHHYTFTIPTHSPNYVEAWGLHDFTGAGNVEGLAVGVDGTVWYACDDEAIRLKKSPRGAA